MSYSVFSDGREVLKTEDPRAAAVALKDVYMDAPGNRAMKEGVLLAQAKRLGDRMIPTECAISQSDAVSVAQRLGDRNEAKEDIMQGKSEKAIVMDAVMKTAMLQQGISPESEQGRKILGTYQEMQPELRDRVTFHVYDRSADRQERGRALDREQERPRARERDQVVTR
jgi:hypothetical protein